MDLDDKVTSKNSYGNIIKAIGLFGGVKVFQIIISIIRSKVIAILIGPAGMGISNLFISTTDLISSVSGCGLQTSSVRDIAQAHDSKDFNRINTTVTILRRLIWLTGFIGAVFTFVFSNALSEFAFGNLEYSTPFKALSIIILFNQLNVGQIALLQGTFHYKYMAKATLVGNVLSLILTLPLYYFFKTNGIVPALITSSAITLGISFLFARKVSYKRVKISFKDFLSGSKCMVVLGLALAIGAELSRVSGYVMNVFISHYGSLEQVGLYTVGISLTNSYVYLVLSAMASDYVPRLSALCGNDQQQISAINKQAIMVTLLLTPLIIVFVVFSKEVITLLYSTEFVEVSSMVELMMLGMLFRGVSWCLAYGFVARGDSKMFLISETTICIISLGLHIAGYILKGFIGVGVAVIIVYIFYTFLLLLLSRRKYCFSFSTEFLRTLIVCTILCVLVLIFVLIFSNGSLRYIGGSIVLILSAVYSFYELDKRVHIKSFISKKLNR